MPRDLAQAQREMRARHGEGKRGGDSNATRQRYGLQRKAFETWLKVYACNKEIPPYRSSWSLLLFDFDGTGGRKWSADVVAICLDFERCVRDALGDDPKTQERFYTWHVAPLLEPDVDPPKLSVDDRNTYEQMAQRVGRLLIRKRMFPVAAYFGRAA